MKIGGTSLLLCDKLLLVGVYESDWLIRAPLPDFGAVPILDEWNRDQNEYHAA